MAETVMLACASRHCLLPAVTECKQKREDTCAFRRQVQVNSNLSSSAHTLNRIHFQRRSSSGVVTRRGCHRSSVPIAAPPIRAHVGEKEGRSLVKKPMDFGASKVAQRFLASTLAAALVLLPANGGQSIEQFSTTPSYPPLAAAVEERAPLQGAADLFAQLKSYANANDEATATGTTEASPRASGEDPVTAAVESIKVAESLDVSKLPEVTGPAKVDLPKHTAEAPKNPVASEKLEAANGIESSKAEPSGGGLLERLKKGADAGRSGIAGSLAESKQLIGAGSSKVGGLVERLKDGVSDLKDGVSDRVAGLKNATETGSNAPVESKAEPKEAGGLKGWFDSWTGAKPPEKEPEKGGFFSWGSQAAQAPAKERRGFFQPKAPKEEKTGLAGAWQSLTNLDFLPDNVKGGALTVKSAASFILTVFSLVLSVFAKALGLAADLIGIIARGL